MRTWLHRWVWCLGLLSLGNMRPAWAAIRVVATLPSLASIAAEVGGDAVAVTAMASASEDPHFVDARPSLVLMLNRADVLLATGLELESGWLPTLQVAARNASINVGAPGYVEAANWVNLLEVPTGKIDRSMGDLHPGGNPHFLNEPTRVADVAIGLARRLGQLDPAHASAYEHNAAAFAARLRTFAQTQTERFARLSAQQRQVVTYHKSLAYVLSWLHLQEVATLEPRPGVSPDPAHVANVLGLMRQQKVKVIVQEDYYPRKSAETLAQLAQAHVAVIHGGVHFNEHEAYLSYLGGIADAIYQAAMVGVHD